MLDGAFQTVNKEINHTAMQPTCSRVAAQSLSYTQASCRHMAVLLYGIVDDLSKAS